MFDLEDIEMQFFEVAALSNRWREQGKTLQAEELAACLPEVQVYPCLWDRAYGGPEEGGWWYDVYEPIERKPAHLEMLRMRLDRAILYTSRIQDKVDAFINAERRSPSSVASEGYILYRWTLGTPQRLPAEKPQYT